MMNFSNLSHGTNSSSFGSHEAVPVHLNDNYEDEEEVQQGGSMSGVSGTGVSGNSKPSATPKQRTIAARENWAVRRLRVIMILTMLALAILACVAIYKYSKSTEQAEFEAAFASQGLKVISGFQGDSFRKLQALQSLSQSFTAYAEVSGSTWPRVTIPDSATHFEPYLSLTNAASLLIMPIVGPRQRYEWEAYVQENLHWIDEDLRTNGMATEMNSTDPEEKEVSTFVKNYVGIDTSPNPWIVWWQYAPVIPNRYFLNFNRLAWEGFEEEVVAVKQGRATLSKTWSFKPGLDVQSTKDFSFTQQLLEAGQHGIYEEGEPLGYLHYPVFDKHEDKQDDKEERQTVAVLTATIFFRTYLQNILTESAGIVCVIENTLGQQFSYKIHGPKADFLGPGDLHDTQYSELGLSANYDSGFSEEIGWYTGVPLDTEHISYRIRVYPSDELMQSYMTAKPILYASSLLVVFLVTVVVFLLYDFCVARRQNIVMSSALKSNAVVDSLFPSNVRDQIMDNAIQKQEGTPPKRSSTFLTANVPSLSADPTSIIGPSTAGGPLADLYPETTVCFADLAGFTSWSSKRTPSEVFELLETIYGAFDRIALRRRVFKVETIGDCYVCVTGIPNPQTQHATILCRFACDCQAELSRLTSELAESLGEDTKELQMRVGLHSGPTTAGVLRGDKGRFQLFGDTVNTAARMESNGVKGRIHVSQATADALTKSGKGKWLVPREEKIEAKGKGTMQTYFVNVSCGRAGSVCSEALSSDCQSAHFRNVKRLSFDLAGNVPQEEAPPKTENLSIATTSTTTEIIPGKALSVTHCDQSGFYDELIDV